MSLILPQKVITKWGTTSRKHYEDIGYKFTYVADEFEVNVEDLSKSASALVKVKCDFCDVIKEMPCKDYNNLKSDKYCCPECLKHKKKMRDENGNLIFVEVPYRNREWLYEEYIVKGRLAKDIADECGVNQRSLREWIHNFGLNNKYDELTKELTKEKLQDLYCDKHLTSAEIGKLFGVSDGTIISLLRKNDIKIPTRSELLDIYYNQKGGYEKVRATQSTMENRIKSSCRQRGISVEEFDGFSVTEQHMARNNTYYKEWQRKVFERDNYTCQCCGKRGGNLNAHHLYNFAKFEELRYDVSNGITLCEQDHLINYKGSFHSIYGEKNNTPEQIDEFIRNKQLEAV